MKIAVLMSTYNGEKYLKEQIDSILKQEGAFEINLIVRDDGSTDNTKSLLEDYQSNNKLTWYEGANLGPAKSFFDLLLSSGNYDYYAFSDQDDVWFKNKLSDAIKSLSNVTKPAIYMSNAILVDENLKSLGKLVYSKMPKIDFETVSCSGGLLGCTMVLNCKLVNYIRENSMPNKVIMHDYYVSELCLALNGSIIYNPNPSVYYRQHDNNVIGVSRSKLSAIKDRLGCVFKKEKISISEQAQEILDLYFDFLNKDKKNWLEKLCTYKFSIRNRFELAFSNRTKYYSENIGLSIRISILLGNK